MNMARSLFLCILFLGLVWVTSTQDACDIPEFVSCMEPIHNATFGHSHGLLQDASELEETCPILREGETCIKNYAERCGTEMIAEDFKEQFEKPALLAREICAHRSTLRHEYLQAVPCLRQNNEDLEACNRRAEEFVSSYEADSDEKEKTVTCMYELISRGCLMSMATDKCGLEAANFIRKALQYTPALGLKLCSE